MHSSHARGESIFISCSHVSASRLQGSVSGAENALPQVVKAVSRMIRAAVPVDKRRAYVIKTLHLIPHRHLKCNVCLPKEHKALARRADRIPFSHGRDAIQSIVGGVVVKCSLYSADLQGELARSVASEIGYCALVMSVKGSWNMAHCSPASPEIRCGGRRGGRPHSVRDKRSVLRVSRGGDHVVEISRI